MHANPGAAGTARGAEPARSNEMLDVKLWITVEFSRGVDFEDKGDAAQAIEHYRKALEIHPAHRDAIAAIERLERGGVE